MDQKIAAGEGQMWRERDPRFVRFVKVLKVTEFGVFVRTCSNEEGAFKRGSRMSRVDRDAFMRGFDFVSAPAEPGPDNARTAL